MRTIGGKGGDGEISFLQLWSNEAAGPDGGDGGHGGHVVFEVNERVQYNWLYVCSVYLCKTFQVTTNVRDLSHIESILQAENGEKGFNEDCFGKNAKHLVVYVPVGTIVRTLDGKIVGDLNREGMKFIAARGGAGGHGNAFFKSDIQQTPYISEYGGTGEDLQYVLEIKSMANIGLASINYICSNSSCESRKRSSFEV